MSFYRDYCLSSPSRLSIVVHFNSERLNHFNSEPLAEWLRGDGLQNLVSDV